MTKRIVDEAMVERAMRAGGRHWNESCRPSVRAALEAALSVPEEIQVTEEMRKKGGDILCGRFGVSYAIAHEGVSHIYRAMRALEPERIKEGPAIKMREVYDEGTKHRRSTDTGANWVLPNHYHRRKDDP